MEGIFNSGLTFWQLIGLIVVTALSIVAVRISFDINKFLERRDKKLQQKLKNACTHMIMDLKATKGKKPLYEFQSLFESPPGTHQWQCQRCGLITNGNDDYEKRAEYYASNPEEYITQQKKFKKLLRKLGYD